METIFLRDEGPFLRAYRYIRGAVIAGDYLPGGRLKVRDIADRLRVSPTPIREALAMLAGEGVIERHHDGGYCVRRQDAQEIADLYAFEMRCLTGLEARMRKQGDQLRRLGPGMPDEEVDSLRSITEWIAALCGSPSVMRAVHLTNDRLSAARRAEIVLWPGLDWRAVFLEKSGDPVSVRNIVADHLRSCIRHSAGISSVVADNIFRK